MQEDCSLDQPLIAGRYALYSRLASGGMASVYLGRLLGRVGFRRTVAVKRLHSHFALDPDFRAMFLDEARLAARIRHPNVVPTLDIVNTNDELFLVMEYVDGESLSALLRRLSRQARRIPLPIVSAIVCDTLAGLHAAHDAKGDNGEPLHIVHRDVSPQNVIVGSDGVSRVLDFGVAKAVGNSVQTRDGHVKGKLAYMAPEQMRDQALTRQADVYAVGVVLWEMTAGRRLFVAETDAGLFAKLLSGEISPPSVMTPGSSTPELDAVIMTGLARDPAARFATARDMARALERAVPPASHQTVADWFVEVAADELSKRHDLLSHIESISSRIIVSSEPPPRLVPPASEPRLPAAPPPSSPTLPIPGAPSHFEAPSGLTPSSVSVSHVMPTTATSPTVVTRPRSPVLFILAGAGAVVVMTLAIGLGLRAFSAHRATRAARSPSAAVSAAPTAEGPTSNDSPAAPAPAETLPAPPVTAEEPPAASPASAARPAPVRSAAPRAGGSAKTPPASSKGPSLYSRD